MHCHLIIAITLASSCKHLRCSFTAEAVYASVVPRNSLVSGRMTMPNFAADTCVRNSCTAVHLYVYGVQLRLFEASAVLSDLGMQLDAREDSLYAGFGISFRLWNLAVCLLHFNVSPECFIGRFNVIIYVPRLAENQSWGRRVLRIRDIRYVHMRISYINPLCDVPQLKIRCSNKRNACFATNTWRGRYLKKESCGINRIGNQCYQDANSYQVVTIW
jgi:hypothetical protein